MIFWHVSVGILVALGAAYVVWSSYQILLAFFAGLIFSIFLHRTSAKVRRFIPMPQQLAVLLVLLVLLGLTAGVATLFASTVAAQLTELSRRVPAASEKIIDLFHQVEAYRNLVPNLNTQASQALVRGSGTIVSRITNTLTNATTITIALIVALVMGVYGALEPQFYLRGALSLAPKRRRDRMLRVLRAVEVTLWQWLLGRLATMLVIGTLTTVALTAFDIPLALILGLLAGLLTIIPYLGPILSAIPAVLIGFSESPATVLTIIGIFIGVQIIEGNLITPMIERRIVRLPPALTIGVQLLLGGTAGVFGIMLASPLTAAVAAILKTITADQPEIDSAQSTNPAQ